MIHVTNVNFSFIIVAERPNRPIDPLEIDALTLQVDVSNRFKLSLGPRISQILPMNCRPFVVIAIAFGGLVPVMQSASAGGPTYQRATATATILSPVTAREAAGGQKQEHSRKARPPKNIQTGFIDEQGFLTTATNPRRHKIIIADMP